ncbi:MAG: AmmeMemoRadiSam system radical SAM enzyme [Spirochaetales bacterium]|nr:AmmeMemoRadiSam system radical SAM enzyme [Spirochaetales bacterium]
MNVQCDLCPKACIIPPGRRGECRIRVNRDGKLCAVTYGYPCAVHKDPIEKKPIFHMLPGSWIFSLATAGCNLHCKNCQNWEISQADPEDVPAYHLPPESIPAIARRDGCASVAYTYTDPVVFYEYTLQGSVLAHEAGLYNVLVTAGYINEAPLDHLLPYIDAANIDLKALSDSFYREICDATLKPVLNTLIRAKQAGVLVEVTNLVIPTLNDSDEDIRGLCRWIAGYMGRETPLHFSRFFPHYRLRHLPPTPLDTLERARGIARENGLYHVYIGNILAPDAENTRCHKCGGLLVGRRGYVILENNITQGQCPWCGEEVYGIWE